MAWKLTTALALLVAFAVFATQADALAPSYPPTAQLYKYKTKIQVAGPAAGNWHRQHSGTTIYDSFGVFYCPKVDEVAQVGRLVVGEDGEEVEVVEDVPCRRCANSR